MRLLSGSTHKISEYLEDTLDLFAEDVVEFLLQTSILDHLSGALCEAITGIHESGELLARLERQQFLLIPLDGADFRAIPFSPHSRLEIADSLRQPGIGLGEQVTVPSASKAVPVTQEGVPSSPMRLVRSQPLEVRFETFRCWLDTELSTTQRYIEADVEPQRGLLI